MVWAVPCKNMSKHEDREGADHPEHSRSLFRAFAVRRQNDLILQDVPMKSKGPDDTLCMHRMM